MNTLDKVIECQSLKKSFSEGNLTVNVLKGIDLSVYQGDSLAILGSSGSGKSTLLHILGGLDKPSSGQVTIDGDSFYQLSEKKKDRKRNEVLGFVFQFHHLLGEFTALENVAMPMMVRGVVSSDSQQRAEHWLDSVGLADRMQHKPAELSGGERQRVAIARALVGDPKCVLADEPTGNLDKKNAEKVLELLLELNVANNTTFLLVTHDEYIADKMHRQLYLQDGVFVDSYI